MHFPPQWHPTGRGTVCMFTNRMLIWPARCQPTLGSGGKARRLASLMQREALPVALSAVCYVWLTKCWKWLKFPVSDFSLADWQHLSDVWIITRLWCFLLVKMFSSTLKLNKLATQFMLQTWATELFIFFFSCLWILQMNLVAAFFGSCLMLWHDWWMLLLLKFMTTNQYQ